MADTQNTNTRVAYDLGLFDPNRRVEVRPPRPPRLSKRARRIRAFAFVLLGIFVVFMIMCVLSNYAKLTELSMEATSLSRQLTKLEQEEEQLRIDINAKSSLETVEYMAKNQFGMVEIQDYQIEYVDTNRIDKAEVIKLSPWDKFVNSVKSAFESLSERIMPKGDKTAAPADASPEEAASEDTVPEADGLQEQPVETE